MSEGMERLLPLFGMVGFPILFVAMWVLVCRIVSLFGWSRLTDRYVARTSPSPSAKSFYWRSISIGSSVFAPGYNGCVNIWLDDTGIFLRPSMMFRLFHPMLFLPWNGVESIEEKKIMIFQQARVQMRGSVPPINFTGGVADALLEHWERTRITYRSARAVQ